MKKLILLLLLGATSPWCLAQQNLPVAGNAAQLTDYLKKDYNTIDPDTRADELIRNRADVIGIFRSYLTDQMSKDLAIALSLLDNTLRSEMQNAIDDYTARRRTIDAKNAAKARLDDDEIAEMATAKTTYNTKQFNYDQKLLDLLATQFGNSNPYLKTMVEVFKDKYAMIEKNGFDAYAGVAVTPAVNKGILNPGTDLSFSVYIDALAKFLAKRIKEELAVMVMEKVKYQLSNPRVNDPFAEFKVLLPATTKYLLNFKADQVLNFQKDLRQMIEDDFDHVLEHAPRLAATPRFKVLLRQYPDMIFAFDALSVIPQLKNIKYPVDYFTLLENSSLVSQWKDDPTPFKHNIANTVRLAGMIAHSLQVMENNEPRFAGTAFLSTYGLQTNFYKLYLGMLYQQNLKYYDISFVLAPKVNGTFSLNGTNTATPQFDYHLQAGMRELMNIADPTKDKDRLQRYYSEIIKEVEDAESMAATIKQANKLKQKIGPDTLHSYIESMATLTERTLATADSITLFILDKSKLLKANYASLTVNNHSPGVYTYTMVAGAGTGAFTPPDLSARAQPYVKVVRTINDLVFDLRKTDYSAGLTKALQLYQELTPENHVTTILDSLQRLANFHADNSTLKWHYVFHEIDSMKPDVARKVSSSAAVACLVIEGELHDLSAYYKTHFSSQPLQTKIDLLIRLVHEGQDITGAGIMLTTADVNTINQLRGDHDFQLLVVSYYTNVTLQPLIDDLADKLTHWTTAYAAPATNGYFSANEVAQIKTLVGSYAADLYNTFIINGKKDLSAANADLRDRLAQLLTSYLASLPAKHAGLPEDVLKLIGFVNGLAQAKDETGIEKALEDFALPTGSYTIKRTQPFNITINSFPGFLPAWEITSGTTGQKQAFSFGFTAPVGICFAWGSKHGTSDGFFIPIIDIGAVTRLRLDSDKDSETLPEFTFRNVFAPGAFYHHGFSKVPLSINAGIQYGPQLRELQSDNTWKSYDSFRLGLGVVLDIPLFNLHTSIKH